jgi:hypothetical protein
MTSGPLDRDRDRDRAAAPPRRPFSLCVYCGSRHGASSAYRRAAEAVGAEIGRRGWQLVYGGGNVGLMGVVADATLAAGGRAVGVIPRTLVEREVGHRALHEQHVVETMHQRKQLMAERADAFVALPGGIGTMDELYEIWTWRQLGFHDQPIGLLNVDGYYDALMAFMRRTVADGFLSPAQHAVLEVGTDPVELLGRLHRLAPQASGWDDFRRV